MMKRRISQTTLDQVALALLLFACFVYFFPRWADPNQNSRLNMIIAVVDDGTFKIDKYVSNTVDYAKVGAHYYSDKPPGTAFLGIPVYAGLSALLNTPALNPMVERLATNEAFQSTLREGGSGIYTEKVRFAIAQVALTVAIPMLASVILGLLMYRLLVSMQVRPAISAAVVVGYSLLTPAFAYAGAFYSHQLCAALLFGAFMLARSEQIERTGRLLLIGLLLGYAVVSEYPVALVAGIIFVFAAYRLIKARTFGKVMWIILPAVLLGVGLMAYNNAIFGGPFNLGYGFSEQWEAQHATGFMSLTLPRWEAVWGMTFGLFRGLFVLSPLLLLSVPGYVAWWLSGRSRAAWWVCLASSLAMFAFNASSVMWWGGFSIGPRYFLPGLPFLAVGLAFALERWGKSAWMSVLAVALSIWSFIATWGLTLAGQAFPSDVIANPLADYALPNWLLGNIARNAGTILGLEGLTSLTPLFIVVLVIASLWWMLSRSAVRSPESELIVNRLEHIA